MIVCACHRRTDRDIRREGPSGPAGTACGGCKAAVDEVLWARNAHIAQRYMKQQLAQRKASHERPA